MDSPSTVTGGSQYPSSAYLDLSKEYHFQPSVSSLGCPYNSVAMENSLDTLKSECLYCAHYTTRSQGENLVAQHVRFYNFERISLKNDLTPYKIRNKAA